MLSLHLSSPSQSIWHISSFFDVSSGGVDHTTPSPIMVSSQDFDPLKDTATWRNKTTSIRAGPMIVVLEGVVWNFEDEGTPSCMLGKSSWSAWVSPVNWTWNGILSSKPYTRWLGINSCIKRDQPVGKMDDLSWWTNKTMQLCSALFIYKRCNDLIPFFWHDFNGR